MTHSRNWPPYLAPAAADQPAKAIWTSLQACYPTQGEAVERPETGHDANVSVTAVYNGL